MGGCCMFGCQNNNKEGYQMFRFPSKKQGERRKRWTINCKRSNWTPSNYAQVCEVHFEHNQFEENRKDGRRLLKWDAVPTLVSLKVPNPPKLINYKRKSKYKIGHDDPTSNNETVVIEELDAPVDELDAPINELDAPINELDAPIDELNTIEEFDTTPVMAPSLCNSNCSHIAELNSLKHVIAQLEEEIEDREQEGKELESQSTSSCDSNYCPHIAELNDLKDKVAQLEEEMEDREQEKKELESQSTSSCDSNYCPHIAELNDVKDKVTQLEKEMEVREKALKKFLNEDQISSLGKEGKTFRFRWKDATIVKALKYRFALGVYGYKYLHGTGFPTPSYSTLTTRLSAFKVDFGVFSSLNEPLKYKTEQLDAADRLCVLSIDEMAISDEIALDKNEKVMKGHITINEDGGTGKKLLVAVICGVKSPYKQIIGAHVTGESSQAKDTYKFITTCLDFCIEPGLIVIGFGSDMGNENRKVWKHVNVGIPKDGIRTNAFTYKNFTIYCLPDVCHLLKNLKSTFLNENAPINLPEDYCKRNNLPTTTVSGKYLKDLWNKEVHQELRFLHHLNRIDIYPDNFQKMNVGSAVRIFSLQTAAAIETAVKVGIIEEEALTTAHFVRLIQEWFSLLSSREKKKSITVRNKEKKYDVLEKMINIIEGTTFGKGWKPLNVGIIMASLSFIDISTFLFLNGFEFVLGHRFTQDAIENIFSQIRNKAGQLPNAVQCLHALKCISISQYMSKISRSSYLSDSDSFLIDFFGKAKQKEVMQRKMDEQLSVSFDPKSTFKIQTKSLGDVVNYFTATEWNCLYNIAGSCTNFILPKCCAKCEQFFGSGIRRWNNDLLKSVQTLKICLSKGGLHDPCPELMQLIINCELLHNDYRRIILKSSYKQLMLKIIDEIDIPFPHCSKGCDAKRKIVDHFFTIRGYSIAHLSINLKRKKVHGSASAKKTRVQ